MPEAPTLLVLNGPSSAGKTSLARALQAQWPTPLVLVSLDKTLAQMPFAFTGDGARADEGHAVRRAPDGGIEIVVGPLGRRLDRRTGAHVAALLSEGLDVVVDYVFVDDQQVESVLGPSRALPGLSPFAVDVRCDPQTLAAREAARGDRLPGLAVHLEAFVHDLLEADLVIDSGDAQPEVLAAAVLQALAAR